VAPKEEEDEAVIAVMEIMTRLICLGLGVIGIAISLLQGPKYENWLSNFFLFSITVCTLMFFINFISMCK
jgi:hypothetical protein